MEYVLNNPAWYALGTGNQHLGSGNDVAKYFDREVSPFVGLRDNSVENLLHLFEILSHNNPILLLSLNEMEIPAVLNTLFYIKGLQMVCDAEVQVQSIDAEITNLTEEHIPQMIALTKLTNPGPFSLRTIEFGHYTGIFHNDELVAMAGQRMHAPPYAEISAVCTHPDHLGKGYARQLVQYQVQRIKASGGIPFLHVRHDNDRAIKVYQNLGFTGRTTVHFYLLQKASQ
ncbi:GNAT family N-acetyltransferase [Mucilaginibacter gynuensis]|uniref:GNAT family N-acetyltransferase n=1 Tax=Mucilaginibacter gynuensis TaxID=1302236 RepID=A0ABP8G1U5_9SPHI